jgi:acetyl-CoA synthetase
VQDHKVTYLGVAPTLMRDDALRRGRGRRFDLSALRITTSGGEAWTEAPWRWFFEHVCKRRAAVHQHRRRHRGRRLQLHRHRASIRCGPAASAWPGSAWAPTSSMTAGRPVPPGQVGELVLRNPNIGLTKSLWRDDERYLDSYWRTLPGIWVHGDFAMRRCRRPVLHPGPQRRHHQDLGQAHRAVGEVETLLTGTGKVSEAAVIGVPDELKGSAIVCVCVPMPGVAADAALEAPVKAVVKGMGTSYRPRQVLLVSDLPKTRNMKIMRRVVRAVYRAANRATCRRWSTRRRWPSCRVAGIACLEAAHAGTHATQQPVAEAIHQPVHFDTLAPFPGPSHRRCAAHVADLFDHVELAQA